MKLGKVRLLWIIIILFIILWVPYFQNIGNDVSILFFAGEWGFLALYPLLLFLGVVLGFLIAVYLKSLVKDLTKQDVQKFDI